MPRKALLIGSSQYQDSTIQDLTAPDNDVTALAELLKHAEVGGFDSVTTSINEPSHLVKRHIEALFYRTRKDDVVLLYFSGHGLVDDFENLYLATTDTDNRYLRSSSVESTFIRTQMDDYSHSKRQMIILDCCFSAKFMSGAKVAQREQIPVDKAFEGDGYGRFVLTATDGLQKAWEGNQIIGDEVQNSIFTYFILEGLRTGQADKNKDGWVDVNDLYTYVNEKLQSVTSKQHPQRYVFQQQGTELRIAKAKQKSIPRSAIKGLAELQDDYYRFIEEANWSAAEYLLNLISALDDVSQRWLEREYKQLERASQQSEPPPPPMAIPSRSKVPDILPKPFEWVGIPAGSVTLIEDYWEDEGYLRKGNSKTFTVTAFEIAKYPITNAQFEPFIEADGYNKQQYWTKSGWQAKTEQQWTEPRYWTDAKWNGTDHPVIGISWYEAYAYTCWLSDVSGETIQLPTEQEWQRAAQGDAGLTYPWGNEWDASRCNNNVDKKDRTTPVTQFPSGASPYGVLDMSGNVWEWCLTDFKTGTQVADGTNGRVLRGGSWYDLYSDYFRAAFRGWYDPDDGDDGGGFRVSRAYT